MALRALALKHMESLLHAMVVNALVFLVIGFQVYPLYCGTKAQHDGPRRTIVLSLLLAQLCLHNVLQLKEVLAANGALRGPRAMEDTPVHADPPRTSSDTDPAAEPHWHYAGPLEDTFLTAVALTNYEDFYGLEEGTATLADLQQTSAGLLGWAGYDPQQECYGAGMEHAQIEQWHQMAVAISFSHPLSEALDVSSPKDTSHLATDLGHALYHTDEIPSGWLAADIDLPQANSTVIEPFAEPTNMAESEWHEIVAPRRASDLATFPHAYCSPDRAGSSSSNSTQPEPPRRAQRFWRRRRPLRRLRAIRRVWRRRRRRQKAKRRKSSRGAASSKVRRKPARASYKQAEQAVAKVKKRNVRLKKGGAARQVTITKLGDCCLIVLYRMCVIPASAHSP